MKQYRSLKVQLHSDEIAQRLKLLGDASSGLLAAEIERKAVAGEFNQAIKAFKQEIKNICSARDSGYEERDVECDIRKNVKKKTMELIRLDDNSVVESRPMEGNEFNADLFDEPEKGTAAGKKKTVRKSVKKAVKKSAKKAKGK